MAAPLHLSCENCDVLGIVNGRVGCGQRPVHGGRGVSSSSVAGVRRAGFRAARTIWCGTGGTESFRQQTWPESCELQVDDLRGTLMDADTRHIGSSGFSGGGEFTPSSATCTPKPRTGFVARPLVRLRPVTHRNLGLGTPKSANFAPRGSPSDQSSFRRAGLRPIPHRLRCSPGSTCRPFR